MEESGKVTVPQREEAEGEKAEIRGANFFSTTYVKEVIELRF